MMRLCLASSIVLLLSCSVYGRHGPCARQQFNHDSFVCVCNATYCDRFPDIAPPSGDDVVIITSSRAEHRFAVSAAQWQSEAQKRGDSDAVLTVNPADKRQTIFGFGAAFTDAAGEDINKLPAGARQVLLEQYFGGHGIGYRTGRIPIGGADFSSRAYTLDDVEGDDTLQHWSLTDEDYNMKLPLIKQANALAGNQLWLFGSAWSAPAWMKNNSELTGYSKLKPEYYQLWADYYVKFLKAYKEEGVTVAGLTTQNEPTNGAEDGPGAWNTMGWVPETQRDWLKNNLGPTVRAYDPDIKLMILDDQRSLLPEWVDTMLADNETSAFADMIAVHWYKDSYTPASRLSDTHDKYPNIPLLYTEACEGSYSDGPNKVALGDWSRLETYAGNIIEDLQNWVTGWTDWNICLNMNGGPNWAGNVVDSPIIIDDANSQFFKNPMFYALGHISATMPPGSSVLPGVEMSVAGAANTDVTAVTALRPDGRYALVILSTQDTELDLTVVEPGRPGQLQFSVPARSLTTVMWQPLS